jgi:hypothetical protein
MGFSNLCVQYLNYPTQILFKSSKAGNLNPKPQTIKCPTNIFFDSSKASVIRHLAVQIFIHSKQKSLATWVPRTKFPRSVSAPSTTKP